MADKFSVGEKVKIKTDNPGEIKRVPPYIKGKVGIVQKARGRISNPRDHRDERPALYLVQFSSEELFPQTTKNDKVIVDVFEDRMTPE